MLQLDKFIYHDIIKPLKQENKTRTRNLKYTKIKYEIKILINQSKKKKLIKDLISQRNKIPLYETWR